MHYVVYKNISGEILRYGVCPNGKANQVLIDDSESVIEALCKSDIDQYVLNGEVVDRPELVLTVDNSTIPADGFTSCSVSGIPEGTTGYIDTLPVGPINDGTLSITFDAPGEYIVELNSFPYKVNRITIYAV